MESEKKGIIIGLTGGIGSGKSTVSRYLMDLGWPVVDSDLIAHQVTEKGSPTVDELAEALGGEILREDGSLDRAKTAEICFNDPAKKEILNRIVWGAMDEISDRQTEEGLAEKGLVFWDIPLLFESGSDKGCDAVWVVHADEEIRIARVMARDGADRDQVLARIRNQMSEEERCERADVVLDNSGSREELLRQVDEALASLI